MRYESGTKILFLTMAAVLIAITGCGELQEAIDDLRTQNVDFYHGIYNGQPVRGPMTLDLVDDALAGGPAPVVANEVFVGTMAENLLAQATGLSEVEMAVSGTVVNYAGAPGRVHVYFAPNKNPSATQAVLIGTVPLDAGETRYLMGSVGFEQAPDEVTSQIASYFADNDTNPVFYVILYTEGVNADSVQVANLRLDASPAFGRVVHIPAEFAQVARDNFQRVVSTSVTGMFRNNGDSTVHIVWAVGSDDPNVDGNLIIETWLEPGRSIKAGDALVVPDGLRRLRTQIENLMDGENLQGNLVVTSSTDVDVDIDDLKVEFEAELRI
ncbi:hypothetical protein K8I61_05805 [bacterium]|nr:hypothetical protein [bacterium]